MRVAGPKHAFWGMALGLGFTLGSGWATAAPDAGRRTPAASSATQRAPAPKPSASEEGETDELDLAELGLTDAGAVDPAIAQAWKPGPQKIDLGHELALDLPEAYVFLGMPEASKLMEKNGSFHNEDLLGLVVDKADDADDGSSWFVVIRYEESGFIKDDESIDSSELLNAMKEGQTEANTERVRRGFTALNIDGWQEPPHYDKAPHHLIWGLLVSDPEGRSLNYNTRVLGRRGYVSLNLVTDPKDFERFRPKVNALLGATSFRSGARYEDFDDKTDKVAEYGLGGLVLGGLGLGAAKAVKLGLFAKLAAVLVKGWKVVVLAIGGGVAALRAKLKNKSG